MAQPNWSGKWTNKPVRSGLWTNKPRSGPTSQVDQQAKWNNKPVRSGIRTWQRSGVSPADSEVIGRAFEVKGKFLPVPSKALAMTSHASRWFLTERSKSQREPIRYFRAHVMTTTLIPSQAMLWRRNVSLTKFTKQTPYDFQHGQIVRSTSL